MLQFHRFIGGDYGSGDLIVGGGAEILESAFGAASLLRC